MYERFDKMIEKLSPTLRRIVRRMNGHFTFFNDDDLYQEALVHMWILFGKGDLNDKTDSYILQGCYFHLKNYVRKTLDKASLVSLSEPSGEDSTTLEDTLASGSDGDYSGIDTRVLAENDIFKSLSEREREVLRLIMEGMTVREAGSRLGISHVMVVKIRARIKEKCAGLKNSTNDGYHN